MFCAAMLYCVAYKQLKLADMVTQMVCDRVVAWHDTTFSTSSSKRSSKAASTTVTAATATNATSSDKPVYTVWSLLATMGSGDYHR
jgi:hypothetical protein